MTDRLLNTLLIITCIAVVLISLEISYLLYAENLEKKEFCESKNWTSEGSYILGRECYEVMGGKIINHKIKCKKGKCYEVVVP